MNRRRFLGVNSGYTLTVITTEGATVMVNGMFIQTADVYGYAYFRLKKGTYSYNISKTGYASQSGSFSIYSSKSLYATLTKLPSLETVSLFHCDGESPVDSKGFARSLQDSLTTVSGKFYYGNVGYVKFSNSQWDSVFLSGSWTVDYWIYPRSASDWAVDLFLGGNSGNWYATIRAQTWNNAIGFFISGGYGWALNGDSVSVSMNTWHHVAIVYDGEYCSIYVGGQRYYHFGLSISSIPGPDNFFGVGWGNQYQSNSYRDEIRISKGVRWTGNFRPPTSPE